MGCHQLHTLAHCANTHMVGATQVAAALAYGLSLAEFGRVLVCDLGGGTFDVSVIETGCESVEVMGVAGDGRLGGNDWDSRLVTYVARPLIRLRKTIPPITLL